MAVLSRMARIAARDGHLQSIPAFFDRCTALLDPDNERAARDAYVSVRPPGLEPPPRSFEHATAGARVSPEATVVPSMPPLDRVVFNVTGCLHLQPILAA
eukprot:4878273-Prymnesium_polylepis.2